MLRSLLAFSVLSAVAFSFSAPAQAQISLDTQVRLIAGYQPQGPDANSPEVLQITQSPAWQYASASASMAAQMRSRPGYFSNASVAKMQSWFAQNAPAAVSQTQNVLYLFGGADILYPTVVFPHQHRILIVGLEKPGQIFDPIQMNAQGTLESQMSSVALAYSDLLQISFFLTKHMSTDLSQFGTSTMIAVGLVARGNTILDAAPVSLNRQGDLQMGSSGRVHGVQIVYRKPDGSQADVLYFSMDLSDASVAARPEFSQFIRTGAFNTAYYKAASYLSYRQGFQNLNRLVLGSVQHVIENDDGIPFNALRENAGAWSLKLYGHYSTPSTLFGAHIDQDLLNAYDETLCVSAPAKDLAIWHRQWASACQMPRVNYGFQSMTWAGTLPFRYGYTWRTGASGDIAKFSNLLVLDRN